MNIRLNGTEYCTEKHSLHELRRECSGEYSDIVTIINGYQTDEDVTINDGDTICFIQKGVMPEEEQLEAMMRARHTPGIYDALKDAKVAVAGLGGLGSNIAVMLARTGVGHLHLIDFDTVDASNLNRQQYSIRHLGWYKTDALKEQIVDINPFLDIRTDRVRVSEENWQELFEKDEIICEAFDCPDAKAMIAELILANTKKTLVAASGMAGIGSSNAILTRRISERFYLCGDGMTEAKAGIGLMAPRVTVCAAHQANIIIQIITGKIEL